MAAARPPATPPPAALQPAQDTPALAPGVMWETPIRVDASQKEAARMATKTVPEQQVSVSTASARTSVLMLVDQTLNALLPTEMHNVSV